MLQMRCTFSVVAILRIEFITLHDTCVCVCAMCIGIIWSKAFEATNYDLIQLLTVFAVFFGEICSLLSPNNDRSGFKWKQIHLTKRAICSWIKSSTTMKTTIETNDFKVKSLSKCAIFGWMHAGGWSVVFLSDCACVCQ